MPKTWAELIPFYRELETDEYWQGLCSMEKLVTLILENRDVTNIHPSTSLHVLCLSRREGYDEWRGRPVLYIEPSSPMYYQFRLSVTLEVEPVLREKSESATCPPEFALEIFDEMVAKMERLESKDAGEA